MAYTKLFSTIVTSTVWGEPNATRIVWVTMLAIATKDGEVLSTIPGLARMANVTTAEAEEAITRFLSPDQYSRTPDDEGRRIEPIEGGWHLLNYDKYRRMASYDESKEQNKERQRRFRERAKRNGKGVTSNENNAQSNAPVTHLLDKAEAEAKKNTLSSDDEVKEAIYQAYPSKRRGGRKGAYKYINYALKEIAADTLLDRVKSFANSAEVKEKARKGEWNFIPLLETWLNKGRYDVEAEKPASTPVTGLKFV
jgi:hypothetical protein